MTFESIVRQWCRQYRFMKDSPKNRRFYFTDSPSGMVELAKGITKAYSPCVVLEVVEQGYGPITRPLMTHPIYFCVMAEKMADGDAAAVAIKEAKRHKNNFMAWLREKHDKEVGENIDGDFARIDMDGYVAIDTIGPLQNGWYAVMIQLEQWEPLNLCVDENLYDEDCEC